MYSRILTDYERTMINNFLEGKSNPETFRVLKMRIKKYQPQLNSDLKLIEQALKKFDEKK